MQRDNAPPQLIIHNPEQLEVQYRGHILYEIRPRTPDEAGRAEARRQAVAIVRALAEGHAITNAADWPKQ